MHPERAASGKEEIGQALRSAADIENSITFGDGAKAVIFEFADQVAVQWLPDGEFAGSILTAISDRHGDLVTFTEQAFHESLGSLKGDARARPIGF